MPIPCAPLFFLPPRACPRWPCLWGEAYLPCRRVCAVCRRAYVSAQGRHGGVLQTEAGGLTAAVTPSRAPEGRLGVRVREWHDSGRVAAVRLYIVCVEVCRASSACTPPGGVSLCSSSACVVASLCARIWHAWQRRLVPSREMASIHPQSALRGTTGGYSGDEASSLNLSRTTTSSSHYALSTLSPRSLAQARRQ